MFVCEGVVCVRGIVCEVVVCAWEGVCVRVHVRVCESVCV